MRCDRVIFIFEGIDGSGKTTQSQILVERFKEDNIHCIYRPFPSNSSIGRMSNELLSNKINGVDDNQRFCFALADILAEIYGDEGILANVEAGNNIICDRFYISAEVYQAGVGMNLLRAGRKIVYKDLESVVVFFLDVTLDNSKDRREKRGTLELYEEENILHFVNEKYREVLITYNNIRKYIIDGNQTINDIAEQIYEIALLELNRQIKE